MIHTTRIVSEKANKQKPIYRAIRGEKQAVGLTAGQALDNLEQILTASGQTEDESTLVILQNFKPDLFFTHEQQKRLRELMDLFHEACNKGEDISAEERRELEQLVNDEWQAAINRTSAILSQADQFSL